MSRNDMQPERRTLYIPILNALKEHGPLHCRDRIPGMVADALGMTEEQRSERYPPEKNEERTKHEKNVAFALTELKRRGMADSDGRGNWRITPAGEAFLGSGLEPDGNTMGIFAYIHGKGRFSERYSGCESVGNMTLEELMERMKRGAI